MFNYRTSAGYRRGLRILCFLSWVCLMGCFSAQPRQSTESLVGKELPLFRGDALDGRSLVFPEEVRDGLTLLLVAYVQNAQFDVDRWVLGALQAKAPIRILELPTIESLGARLARGFIDEGMRKGIPRQDWASVVTVYRDAKTVSSFVGPIQGSNACALLVDGTGTVRWVHRDGYSPRKLLEMLDVVRSLQADFSR